MSDFRIIDTKDHKICQGDNYHSVLNKNNGTFVRFGKTVNDDPKLCEAGPEILDWEISTICDKSVSGGNCEFCYKSNTKHGGYIEFETFKEIFEKLPKTIGQIAYGIGSLNGHPKLFEILEYTRNAGVIPNITINGDVTDEEIEKLSKLLGAVAVSHYSDDVCFDAVCRLCKASKKENSTLRQVNIHALLHAGSVDKCKDLFNKVKTDDRLKGLNAIVLLMAKPKGRGKNLRPVEYEVFKDLFIMAQSMGIAIGMDSCSAPFVLKASIDTDQQNIIQSIEPCESTLFSIYMDYMGNIWPCSFHESVSGFTPISMLEVKDFVKDVWHSAEIIKWRDKLLKSSDNCECAAKEFCRSCPIYDITLCKLNNSVHGQKENTNLPILK